LIELFQDNFQANGWRIDCAGTAVFFLKGERCVPLSCVCEVVKLIGRNLKKVRDAFEIGELGKLDGDLRRGLREASAKLL
jgi:hypothetical protein